MKIGEDKDVISAEGQDHARTEDTLPEEITTTISTVGKQIVEIFEKIGT